MSGLLPQDDPVMMLIAKRNRRIAELESELAALREALKETEAFLTAAIKACKCL